MTSKWSRMKPISASSDTYSARWRTCRAARRGRRGRPRRRARRRRPSSACRTAGSARGRPGGRSSRPRKTLAPPSVADATIFGVWISVKPSRVERCAGSRRPRRRRAGSASRCRGWRSATAAWSRMVGSCSFSSGRRSSIGGGSAGSDSTLKAGSRSSIAAGRLLARHDGRLDLEHRLRQEPRDRFHRLRLLDDDLRQPRTVAEQDEGQPGQPALVVEPAGRAARARRALLACPFGAQFARERPFHVRLLMPSLLRLDGAGEEAIPAVPPLFAASQPRWSCPARECLHGDRRPPSQLPAALSAPAVPATPLRQRRCGRIPGRDPPRRPCGAGVPRPRLRVPRPHAGTSRSRARRRRPARSPRSRWRNGRRRRCRATRTPSAGSASAASTWTRGTTCTSGGAGSTRTTRASSSSTGRRPRRGPSTPPRRSCRSGSIAAAASAPRAAGCSTSPTRLSAGRSATSRARSATSCSRSSSAAATSGCATSSRRSRPTSTG